MECSCPESVQYCPLCHSTHTAFFCKDNSREYFSCADCALIFVPPCFHLSPEAEKAQYDLHKNEVFDPHYRQFLSRLFKPVCSRLHASAVGLEFGCGPGPALLAMFHEAGYEMSAYDPFYHPDKSVLDKRYDFITMTEVAEHLCYPAEVFEQLFERLLPGGMLAVMTKRASGLEEDFVRWHYKNDPTHICFFSLATFGWMAKHFNARVWVVDKDVVIFFKQV